MRNCTYGYVRVSSLDQNEERQLMAMKTAQVADKNIFIDKLLVKDFNRPQYSKVPGTIKFIQTVKSIDISCHICLFSMPF